MKRNSTLLNFSMLAGMIGMDQPPQSRRQPMRPLMMVGDDVSPMLHDRLCEEARRHTEVIGHKPELMVIDDEPKPPADPYGRTYCNAPITPSHILSMVDNVFRFPFLRERIRENRVDQDPEYVDELKRKAQEKRDRKAKAKMTCKSMA